MVSYSAFLWYFNRLFCDNSPQLMSCVHQDLALCNITDGFSQFLFDFSLLGEKSKNGNYVWV